MTTKAAKRKARSIVIIALTAVMILTALPMTAFAKTYSQGGYSSFAQTVYTGPGTFYATAGSIGNNEHFYILAKENGWYHIVYNVTNSTTQKSGYIPINNVSVIYGTPQEDTFYGGFCYANGAQDVYSCDDRSTAVKIGSVGNLEGVTRLNAYNSTASNGVTYVVYFIEYSTSSGPKRGYMFNPSLIAPTITSVARVKSSTSVYYGLPGCFHYDHNANFGVSGALSAGEFVSVVAKNGDYLFVEYNTNQGRKRGYIYTSSVEIFNGPVQEYPDVPFYKNDHITRYCYSDVPQVVYSGPGTSYTVVETIPAGRMYNVDEVTSLNGFFIIQYLDPATNTLRSGYIR